MTEVITKFEPLAVHYTLRDVIDAYEKGILDLDTAQRAAEALFVTWVSL